MASSDNLEHWEALAAFHGTGDDRFYDLDAVVRGDLGLGDAERAAVRLATRGEGVQGRSVAHVQCHLGIGSVDLARQGAIVTAFDFSPTALRRARELADRCLVRVETVLADSQDLGTSAYAAWHGRFDLVFASIGVICWIGDLAAWMRGARALLRPGGRLVLVELHPLVSMLESVEPLVVDFPYVNDGGRRLAGTGSYANPGADVTWTTVEHAWSVGEVVSAAVEAGLAIVRLEEHVSAEEDARGAILARDADGRYRLRIGTGADGAPAEPLPVLFTLVAERPAVA